MSKTWEVPLKMKISREDLISEKIRAGRNVFRGDIFVFFN